MAVEQLYQIVTGAGIPKEEIEKIMALDKDAQDFKADEYISKISSGIEEKIKNDNSFWEGLNEDNVNPALKKKIEAQQYGRAANIMRSKALKALNMKEDDLNDLSEEDQKNVETFITKAIQKHLSGNENAASKLQADLIAERTKLEKLESSLPEKEKAIADSLQAKYDNEKLSFIIMSQIAAIKDLPVPAKYLASSVIEKLTSKYKFDIEGFDAIPKQKENPALKVLEGNKTLSLNDLIQKTLKEDGILTDKKDNGNGGGGAGRFRVEPGANGLAISSHIAEKMNQVNPETK